MVVIFASATMPTGVTQARAAAPLMIPLGAVMVNNSGQTAEQTSGYILGIVRQRLKEREDARLVAQQKPRW